MSDDAGVEPGACAELGTSPSTCGAGAALCEGFETGIQSLWALTQVATRVSVDNACSKRGAHSLRISTDPIAAGENVWGELEETVTEMPTPMTDYFVRMFVWVDEPLPPNYFRIAHLLPGVPPSVGIGLRVHSTGVLAVHDSFSGLDRISTTQMPTRRWACLEYEVHVGASGTIRIWLDDGAAPVLGVAESIMPSPPIAKIGIGIRADAVMADQAAINLWVDEVEIADTRIGCAP